MSGLSERDLPVASDAARRRWDKHAAGYDKQMGWAEKHLLGPDHRTWACSRARGEVLEVAIGTGLNLPLYRPEVTLTGIDLSPAMLELARNRAVTLGIRVNLVEGDAHHLPFPRQAFDAVVCTFSLCTISDVGMAVREMKRVLKPGGRLVLVDHVRSSSKLLLRLQRVIEFLTRIGGEYLTRRPLDEVIAQGFEIAEQQRLRKGVVERVVAIKPEE